MGDILQVTDIGNIFFLGLWTSFMTEICLTELWEIQLDFPKHFPVV